MHTLSDVQQATLNKLQLLLEQIDSNANANGMLALLLSVLRSFLAETMS
jgi:hypothetical protein